MTGSDGSARRSRFRGFITRAAIAVSATLVALALSEVAFRLLGIGKEGIAVRFESFETAPDVVRDPELFWRLAPKAGCDHVHDIGVRGTIFSSPRSERDFRVLCVGDSCTFGLFVRLRETYGTVLDRLLQDRLPGACVETVLAAAPGYSTHQDLVLVRRHAEALDPDVTVLFVGVQNDALPALSRDSVYAADIMRLERHPFWSLRLGRQLWNTLHPPPDVTDMWYRYDATPPAERGAWARVSLDEFAANVRALVAWARARGAVVGVLPGAETTNSLAFPWLPTYHRMLGALYRELGVRCISVDDAFRSYPKRHPEFSWRGSLFSDRVHPIAAGHEAIAEALEPVVLELAPASVRALEKPGPDAGVKVTSVEPAALQAGRPGALRIQGTGFAGPGAPARIFVERQPVSRFRVVDDGTIEVALEPEFVCTPGPLSLVLRTRAGVRRPARVPEVRPWAFDVSESLRGPRRTVSVLVDTEASLGLNVWLSTSLNDPGMETELGRFRLADPLAVPLGAPLDDQLGLPALARPHVAWMREKTGPSPVACETDYAVPRGVDPAAPLYAQVLIRWGRAAEAAWLSDVVTVRRR